MGKKLLVNKFIVALLILPLLSSCKNLFSTQVSSSNDFFNAIKGENKVISIGSDFTIKTTDDFFSIIENLKNRELKGNNHTITISNQQDTDFKFLGLFQTIADSKLSDLNIVYDFPLHNGGNKRGFGGLAYKCDSSVLENVKVIYNYDISLQVSSNFFSYSKYEDIGTIGGLVANLVGESQIDRCIVSGNFTNTSSALFGGVVGYQSVSSTITNSSFEGSIVNVGNQRAYINRLDQSACGGLVGYLSGTAYGNYVYLKNLNASLYNETWNSFTYSAGGLYGCVSGEATDSYIDFSNDANINFDDNFKLTTTKAISNKHNTGIIIGNIASTGKVKNIYADLIDFVGGKEFNKSSSPLVYGVGTSESINCSNIYTVNNTHFFNEETYYDIGVEDTSNNSSGNVVTTYTANIDKTFDFSNVKFDIVSDSSDNRTLSNFVFTLNDNENTKEYTLQPNSITNSISGYFVDFSTVITQGDFYYSIEAVINTSNSSIDLNVIKQHKKVLYNSYAQIVNNYSDIHFSSSEYNTTWNRNSKGKYMLKGVNSNIKY